MTSPSDLRSRDLRVIWHPCTQMREHPDILPLIPIQRGEGAWLIAEDGTRYLDAISSWWTNLFGHSESRIAAAIAKQATTLEHVLLAGFTHEPAILLAERLLALAPKGLSRVFYVDNGSAAVEVALKMSFHAHRNLGDTKRLRFITLKNSYHGETLGALSMGDIPLYRRTYAPLLLEPIFAPSPDAFNAHEQLSAEQCAHIAADALESLCHAHHGEISALIIEPLVQCAGGMRMYHPAYLQRARAICDQYGIHLIADEIAVGFGRTGTFFACEQGNITPDFLCLSKGITGGFMPLAAVLASQAIYEAFLDDSRERAFLHSHSYSGNPLGCAAALATLDIFSSDAVIESNLSTAKKLHHHAQKIAQHPHLLGFRQTGMICAFELMKDPSSQIPFSKEDHIGLKVYRAALKRGLLLRPLGDVLYWMPPYCLTDSDLDHLASQTLAAIEDVLPCD